MQSSLRFQAVASRFEPFVEDLHSLFEECNVAYGSPEHLSRFREELIILNVPLRFGTRSVVRRVLQRAQEPVSHGDLVELILVAAGGTEVEEDTPAVQSLERAVSQLVGEAMTSPLRDALPQGAKVDHMAAEPAADPIILPEMLEEKLEERAAARNAGPKMTVWASPPPFIWAALLCGVLLAPCMYLLSRPRPLPAAPPPHVRSLPPASPSPIVPVTNLVPWTFEDPLSLAPGHTRSFRLNRRSSGANETVGIGSLKLEPPKQQAPASGEGAEVVPGTATAPSLRDTDMPGRDRTPPASQPTDPQQTSAPES